MEKDDAIQFTLLNMLQKRQKKFEVLRMEVRLNQRKKIKHMLAKLDMETELTFKKLFKPALSKKILLHYLDEIESRRPLLLNYKPKSDRALLAELIFNNHNLTAKQIFQAYGLKKAMDEMNLRELRLLLSHCSAHSWYRLMADTQKIKLPNVHSPLGKLREEIEKFKALSIEKI